MGIHEIKAYRSETVHIGHPGNVKVVCAKLVMDEETEDLG